MLKHAHREFISDPFVLFESVGATLTIGNTNNEFTKHGVKIKASFNKTNNISV